MPSIQPVLGHKPITSYFSPVSLATKRKRNTETAVSTSVTGAKRQKQTGIASSVSPIFRRKGKLIYILKELENGTPSTHTRDMAWPRTPLPRKTTMGITLASLTPPATVGAPSRSRIPSDKGPGLSIISDTLVTPFLVTPTSPMPTRFCSGTKRLDKPCRELASSKSNHSNDIDFLRTDEDTTENVDLTVSSSQSQDTGDSAQIPHFVINSLLPSANNCQSRTLGEEESVVNSSQSQLLPLIAPGERGNDLRYQATEVALEFIPSSQSQERELSMLSVCRNDARIQQSKNW